MPSVQPYTTISPQLLRKALRVAARKTLLAFTTYTFPQYRAENAHKLLARELDAVLRGTTDRLMLWVPPQHGKSELASVHMPPLWMGQHPDDPVLLCSYAADLAYSFSRRARGVVEGDAYQDLFPGIHTSRDSRAVNQWDLSDHRGGLLASGVGGPITGYGARLGVIDDPFENWEQAQSPTYRERVWEWYATTFLTRIWEGGRVVLVMTRWHEDDLAGRILKAEPGRWRVLRLPAIAETGAERADANRRLGLHDESDPLGRAAGEPLCPGRFSKNTLLERIATMTTVRASGIMQQNPLPAEGQTFKRAWFTVIDDLPNLLRQVRYWDKAATSGAGCKTAGVRMGVDADGRVIIVHSATGHLGTDARRQMMLSTMQGDGHAVTQWIEAEGGSSGVDVMRDEGRYFAGVAVRFDRPTGSKDVRLEPFAAQAEHGNVYLVRGNWNMSWLDEICALPNGTYRDESDATAGAYNKLAAAGRKQATSRQG